MKWYDEEFGWTAQSGDIRFDITLVTGGFALTWYTPHTEVSERLYASPASARRGAERIRRRIQQEQAHHV